MARLESEAKGGYYPTPPEELELVLKRVKAVEGDILAVLDPCVGKGQALKQIQDHLKTYGSIVTTYGIEIEKTRAKEAEDYVDHVLACGYEDTRISHDAFSLLYLNPPFMEIRGERAETMFMRDLTSPDGYLSYGALVILNMPQYALTDVAKLIATRLENVKIYRFTDANYNDFRQVIVYGYRRAPGQGRNKELEEYLIEIGSGSSSMLQPLNHPDWEDVQFIVPAQRRQVDVFSTTIVEPSDILKSEQEINFLDKVFARVEDVRLESGRLKQPAMPLKITHQVQAIQSGALPEHMGDHLLVAKDESVHTKHIEVDPETGKARQVENFKRKSIIRTFTATGHLDLK